MTDFDPLSLPLESVSDHPTVFSLSCLFLHCESGLETALTPACVLALGMQVEEDKCITCPGLHASSWAYKMRRLLWQGDSAHRELASLPFEENFPGGSVHVTLKPVHHGQAENLPCIGCCSQGSI